MIRFLSRWKKTTRLSKQAAFFAGASALCTALALILTEIAGQ
jgi:hypothetical protein